MMTILAMISGGLRVNRESDIQELCKQVLEMNLKFIPYYDDDHEMGCPLCEEEMSPKDNLTIQNFKHDPNCAYLIAKDLSANQVVEKLTK